MKAQIFEKYDVASCDKTYKGKDGCDELLNDVYEKKDFNVSNLYFCFELEFGPIIEFIKEKKMYDGNIINKMYKVKELRNMVMHHNLITCGKSKNTKDFNLYKKSIWKRISLLKELLPQEYQKGFIDDINKLKCDCNLFKIVLE